MTICLGSSGLKGPSRHLDNDKHSRHTLFSVQQPHHMCGLLEHTTEPDRLSPASEGGMLAIGGTVDVPVDLSKHGQRPKAIPVVKEHFLARSRKCLSCQFWHCWEDREARTVIGGPTRAYLAPGTLPTNKCCPRAYLALGRSQLTSAVLAHTATTRGVA